MPPSQIYPTLSHILHCHSLVQPELIHTPTTPILLRTILPTNLPGLEHCLTLALLYLIQYSVCFWGSHFFTTNFLTYIDIVYTAVLISTSFISAQFYLKNIMRQLQTLVSNTDRATHSTTDHTYLETRSTPIYLQPPFLQFSKKSIFIYALVIWDNPNPTPKFQVLLTSMLLSTRR